MKGGVGEGREGEGGVGEGREGEGGVGEGREGEGGVGEGREGEGRAEVIEEGGVREENWMRETHVDCGCMSLSSLAWQRESALHTIGSSLTLPRTSSDTSTTLFLQLIEEEQE